MTLEPGQSTLLRSHRLDQRQAGRAPDFPTPTPTPARHGGEYYICSPAPHLNRICVRRIHETCPPRRGSARHHVSLRAQAATPVLCTRSGTGRADPRVAYVHERDCVSRRVIRRRIHRGLERRLARAVRVPLRQGQSAALARCLSGAFELRSHTARGRRLERRTRSARVGNDRLSTHRNLPSKAEYHYVDRRRARLRLYAAHLWIQRSRRGRERPASDDPPRHPPVSIL